MSPTKEQRAMMAAHLCDIAAKMLRSGDYGECRTSAAPSILTSAKWLLEPDTNPSHYADGLASAGLSPVDIDTAVAAIARGEHPADSLPGQVKRRIDAIVKAATDGTRSDADMTAAAGASAFSDQVLDLLGCPVTS